MLYNRPCKRRSEPAREMTAGDPQDQEASEHCRCPGLGPSGPSKKAALAWAQRALEGLPVEGVFVMKKFLATAVLSLTLMVTLAVPAFAADSNYTTCMAAIDEHRTIQSQAHQAAEAMRKMGYSESSAYIQSAKTTWKEAAAEIAAYQRLSKYSDEDIRILATTVYYEAGGTTDQLREYVAQVVLNRVASSRFPNTVKAVITQPGQYAGKYATAESAQAAQRANSNTYNTCVGAAKRAMMGKVDMPANVLFQANFAQGSGVWKSVYFNSGWFSSTSYFCYL